MYKFSNCTWRAQISEMNIQRSINKTINNKYKLPMRHYFISADCHINDLYLINQLFFFFSNFKTLLKKVSHLPD